jgi:hypothetical protein
MIIECSICERLKPAQQKKGILKDLKKDRMESPIKLISIIPHTE